MDLSDVSTDGTCRVLLSSAHLIRHNTLKKQSMVEQENEGAAQGTNGSLIARRLEGSRRDVLDLSMRNSLLNFRPSGRLGIEVVDELPSEIFRILVHKHQLMYFSPVLEGASAPAMDQPDEDSPPGLTAPDIDAEPAARHVDKKLQTALEKVMLHRRLLDMFRRARSALEEQGVNTLYLALGLLRWYESEQSELPRLAPLILIPVQLDRADVRRSFKLSWTEEEIEANLSLNEKLGNDFGVQVPDLPKEDDLDAAAYFQQVGKALSGHQRWSVDTQAIHLGFFSFSKFLIYKDLDPAQWPEGQKPADHPVLQKCYDPKGFQSKPSVIGDTEPIDDHPDAPALHPVVDADSSQTLAVIDAMDGRNLVIQGPPGTGKSQTITNLLAEALAHGKSVLFVAEKRAALEVVKRRLDSIYLGDACLELHSHNTRKRVVLDELKRTLDLGEPTSPSEVDDTVLRQRRQRLNAYAAAVNEPVGASGLTPHQLIGKLEALQAVGLAVDGLGLRCRDSASWSASEFARHRALVAEMQSLVLGIGPPREHLFWGMGLRVLLPSDEHRIQQALQQAEAALRRLREPWRRLQTLLLEGEGIEALRRSDVEQALHMADKVLEVSALIETDHRNPVWATRARALRALCKDAFRYADLRARYEAVLIPEAWEAEVLEVRQALAAQGGKWWRFLSGSWRKSMAVLRGLCRGDPPEEMADCLELVDRILEAGRLRRRVVEAGDWTAALLPGLQLGHRPESYRTFAQATTCLINLHEEKAAGTIAETVHDLIDRRPIATEVQQEVRACRDAVARLEQALEAVDQVIERRTDRFPADDGLWEQPYGAIHRWLAAAMEQLPSASKMVRFNQLEQKAIDAKLPELAEAAASYADAGEKLLPLFEHGCYSTWIEAAIRERSALSRFDGDTQQGITRQFRDTDRSQFESNRIHIAQLHWQGLPRHQGGGQLGVLQREFQKKSRHLPVRTLIAKAGHAIQSLKPIFMMSPMSIAKYIPPASVSFDIVVFDEASQVRPVDAMGAILRGRQAVVVGDSRQLPPTSFFDGAAHDAEEEQSSTADLESVLGLFCAQGAPERWLRWHYRSRHESLITVSNHEFYDNRLVVFPSPDASKQDSGLHLQHQPENQYKRGGVNVDEARKVAAAVMEHAARTPLQTLGVVAFNMKQARRIEDELEILRSRDPSLEATFFSQHPAEPFFVKNLENVQGDERDVILISVGYGKLEGGYLPMNFGPLNRDGGERRLNVLITRAKRRCVVYVNFLAADLDLRRSKGRGIQALKTFLKYADQGVLDVPRATGRGADSPFEEAVADALRAKGHDIEQQVGSSGFFVDLAVVDPDRPGQYVLGIECDGAKYHSARSARDRDRLRQQVLENLGWSIHRIWSTDWFRNRERSLQRTEEAIQNACSRDSAKPSAEVSPKGETEAGSKVPPHTEPNVEPKAKPLQRSQILGRKPKSRAQPYKPAQPNVDLGDTPLHEMELSQLAASIRQVVEVESPVHWQEVVTRIRVAAGLRRAGSRIREHMKQGIRHGLQSKWFDLQGDFLWRLEHDTVIIRSRSGPLPDTAKSLRQVDRIAPEEIAEALYRVVDDSFAIRRDEAIDEACRLFGFKRVDAKTTRRFKPILNRLVKNKKLQIADGLLRVCR